MMMFNPFLKRAEKIRQIRTPEEFDALLTEELFVLFKHSTGCSNSWAAHSEVARFRAAQPDIPIYLVSVIPDRALARYVAEKTGIDHASPQVLVVRHGRVVGLISHQRITRDALARLIEDQKEVQ